MDLGSESMLVGGENQNQNCKNSCSNVEVEGEGAATADADAAASNRSTTKGFGLKKWRRIRRKDQVEIQKETETETQEKEKESDSESTGRMLKRVLNENENGEKEKDVSGSGFVVGSTSNCNSTNSTSSSNDKSEARQRSVKDHHHRKSKTKQLNPKAVVADPLKKARESSPLSSSDSRSSSTASVDPLLQSLFMLHSAQLALQTEVQKFEEIGKGISSLCDDTDKTSGVPIPPMSGNTVNMNRASDGGSEFNHSYLSKIVQTLERQLIEAEASLKEKELRIAELEKTTIKMESPQDYVRSTMDQHYLRCIEMEAELQDLFKQKLEAEVQTVVVTGSTKDFSVLVEDKIKLICEQNSPARKQAQSPGMTVDIENTAVKLQGEAEKSHTLYTGSLGGEEIAKMQRGVVKFTSCFFIQLVLLVLVFALFVLQLVPKSAVVVPT